MLRSPCLQLEAVLEEFDNWTFDVFKLASVSEQRPLSSLAFALFKSSGIMYHLGLDKRKLAR